jgi:single-strand DNA-binding protein
MVNKVILIGRLAADPEVRYLSSGTQLTTMRVATTGYGSKEEDGSRKEFTDFHSLVLFGRLAEVAGSYLRKGRLVYAEGRLRHRSWDGADGAKRYSTEVVVESLQLLSPKPDETAGRPSQEEAEAVGV